MAKLPPNVTDEFVAHLLAFRGSHLENSACVLAILRFSWLSLVLPS